ncbi:uncharacterized protein LOC127726363 [Mytilus californianus]|uniref:uncharacterized protein LOC127726363 n=1 Tax=Mytilus californianus TaxID=6549 RepID=UPI002247655D|nr:uncharacterized protein LOC127726363 [Mytilus californianus]
MVKIGFFCMIVMCVISNTDASCQFKDSLQGRWNGGYDADTRKNVVFSFDGDTLRDFTLNMPTLSQSDFTCVESYEKGDTTIYTLQNVETPQPIFGIQIDIYFCLAVKGEEYSILTGLNPILKDKVYGVKAGTSVLTNDICNQNGNEMNEMTQIADQISMRKSEEITRLVDSLERELEDRP